MNKEQTSGVRVGKISKPKLNIKQYHSVIDLGSRIKQKWMFELDIENSTSVGWKSGEKS